MEIGVPPGHRLEPTALTRARTPAGVLLRNLHHAGWMREPSRHGLPGILGRQLEVRTLNLGFSGNAKASPRWPISWPGSIPWCTS